MGKISANAGRKLATNALKNPARFLEIGANVAVDVIYPDNIEHKSRNFPFCPENKIIDPKNFTEYMKEYVPKPYRPTRKFNL